MHGHRVVTSTVQARDTHAHVEEDPCALVSTGRAAGRLTSPAVASLRRPWSTSRLHTRVSSAVSLDGLHRRWVPRARAEPS